MKTGDQFRSGDRVRLGRLGDVGYLPDVAPSATAGQGDRLGELTEVVEPRSATIAARLFDRIAPASTSLESTVRDETVTGCAGGFLSSSTDFRAEVTLLGIVKSNLKLRYRRELLR
jgi:hypothetical protein